MGSLFSKPKAPKPLPPPAIPIPEEQTTKRKIKKTEGRASTIVTGDLAPDVIGKKNLLGR